MEARATYADRPAGAGRRISLICVGALAAVLVAAQPAAAETFTVNETGDDADAALADSPNACDSSASAGLQCTLRAAIEEANDTPGADRIEFGVPGGGVHRIEPGSALPQISGPTAIDGYSQPGATPNTNRVRRPIDAELRIVVSGGGEPISAGLDIAFGAAGTSVRGLVINGFQTGILMRGQTIVAGNFIGTNAAGTRARPNGFDAVFGFSGASTVGGSTPADRNLLSGNGRAGITTNPGLTIQGNYIGVAADASSPLPNRENGIDSAAIVNGTEVGGPGQASNVIAFNIGDAIQMVNASTGSTVSRNSIFDNRPAEGSGEPSLGLDLNDDGVSPNDPGDGDGGANGTQNFPKLTAATSGRRATRVEGRLSSTPATAYRLEFFSNRDRQRQGERFIGAAEVTTDAAGVAGFDFKPRRRVAPGRKLTATATDPGGSTSEFSAPRRVRAR